MNRVSSGQGAEGPSLPSLRGEVDGSEVSAALTEAGLLVERVELIAELYAEHQSWSKVKEVWHEERVSRRGSRSSAQKIFRVLRRRLQSGGRALPGVPRLAEILEACRGKRTKAQIVYLYFVHADPLAEYVVRELIRKGPGGDGTWDLSPGKVEHVLGQFRDANGEPLPYASSTCHRWAQGLRSALHDIGVRKAPYDEKGDAPTLERPALLVATGYSFVRQGEQWQENPVGWRYLFQPTHHWATLIDRLQAEPSWSSRDFQNRLLLEPQDNPFAFEL